MGVGNGGIGRGTGVYLPLQEIVHYDKRAELFREERKAAALEGDVVGCHDMREHRCKGVDFGRRQGGVGVWKEEIEFGDCGADEFGAGDGGGSGEMALGLDEGEDHSIDRGVGVSQFGGDLPGVGRRLALPAS